MDITPVTAWMPIAQWNDSRALAKPGVVFEIQNADGETMLTSYVVPMPAAPFDWKSPPLQFRVVVEPAPRHSDPIPSPRR